MCFSVNVLLDGNSDEELCNRWMQLSAFTPFYRNHNIKGALSQEPYRWDSVANASRTAIGVRYSLLPYWVSGLLIFPRDLNTNRPIVYTVRQCFDERYTTCAGIILRIP